MKQLTGLDAAFLYMETPTTFGHVTALMIFERPNPDYDPYAAVYAKYASLVGQLEPLRRRLVGVPFGLDHPYWVADPNFDLDFHIREIHLARPGMVDQLAEQVSRIVGRPMDRSRPLWEVYVIDGLHSGRWALLTKYHHATIDGAAGQLMLNILTDTDPDAPAPGRRPVVATGAAAGNIDLLRRTVGNLASHPVHGDAGTGPDRASARRRRRHPQPEQRGRQAGAGIKAIARLGKGDGPNDPAADHAGPAHPVEQDDHRPPPLRHADHVSGEHQAAQGLPPAATVNDIVMAICAGGLREYLLAHDALPDRPLRAMVPVSIRTGEETDPWTNRVSAIVADLPTDCDDPVERVARCRQAMLDAKRLLDLVPANELVDLTQFSAPVLATAAVRLASRLRLANRVAQPFNLVISNVPGPRQPLYFAGAQLCHQFPVSIVTDGQGLNITVASYLDRLDFGFIADRDLVPDVWELADMHIAEIGRLFDATGAEWAQPPQPPAPRRGPIELAQTAAKPTANKSTSTTDPDAQL